MSDDASWYVDGAPPPPIPPVPAAAADVAAADVAAAGAAGDAPESNTCLLTFSTSSGLKSVSASAQPTPAENHSSATRGTLTLVPEVTNELEELLLPLNEFEEPPTTAMTRKNGRQKILKPRAKMEEDVSTAENRYRSILVWGRNEEEETRTRTVALFLTLTTLP